MSRKNGHLFFRKPVETKNMLLGLSLYFVTIRGKVAYNALYYFLTIMTNGNKWKPNGVYINK